MIRLSHSSSQKFINCGMQWKLHYVDKLKPIYKQSSLFFGSALDEAIGRLLLEKKNNLTKEEINLMKMSALEVFDKSFETTEIAGEDVSLSNSTFVRFFNTDFDNNILTEEDHIAIEKYATSKKISLDVNGALSLVNSCRNTFKAKHSVGEDLQLVYNFCHYISLKRKAYILLAAYERNVLPLIEEVFAIQKEVTLPNEDGDIITGWIDFIASFVDDPGVKYIMDNKTSSKAYPKDAVQTSPQLATYCEAEDTVKGGFVVVEKKIRKRSPKCRIAVMKGDIPEEQFEDTFDNFDTVLRSIKDKEFDKNMDNCFQWGTRCCYYDYCRNGSMNGLKDMKNKK